MFILHFKLKHSALAASANSTWVLLKFKQRRQILYLTEIPWGFLSVAFSMLFIFLSWSGIVCIIVIIAWLRTHFLKNKVDQSYITAALSNKCLLTELTEMTRKKKKEKISSTKQKNFSNTKNFRHYMKIFFRIPDINKKVINLIYRSLSFPTHFWWG